MTTMYAVIEWENGRADVSDISEDRPDSVSVYKFDDDRITLFRGMTDVGMYIRRGLLESVTP